MSLCMSISVHPCIGRRWLALRRALLRIFERIHSFQGNYASVEVNLLSSAALPLSEPSPGGLEHIQISQKARKMGVYVTKKGKIALSDNKGLYLSTAVPPSEKEEHWAKLKPRRIRVNGLGRSACLFTRRGQKGLNQDAMVVWEDFGFAEGTTFCGVFDGHGPHGHRVAQQVRDSLPLKLLSSSDTASSKLDSVSLWKECFANACKLMDKELKLKADTDCFSSGTTAVTLVKQGRDVVIANVGDSRAILGTISDTGAVTAVQLTVDLKASLPKEAERIKRSNGRIFALRDEPKVQRVWLPHENSPGLAMARAFGDFCLKDFGVIAVPDITYRQLTDSDLFIVLATDGVWDVLSNEQVVQIVCSVPQKSQAAKAVIEYAVRGWRYKYPTSKMDDCAVICLYVDHPTMVSHSTTTVTTSAVDTIEKSSSSHWEPNPEDTMLVQKKITNNLNKDLKQVRQSENQYNGVNEYGWSALEGVSHANSLVSLPRYTVDNRRLDR